MSYYQMQRGWQEHALFEGDEYSRRDAWEWLVANAVWKETKKRLNGKIITIQRGELAHSVRFLADKWLWHRAKAERFLKCLKTETMIETRTESGRLIITICNYEDYQAKPKDIETRTETRTEERARHERDKEEEGKELKNTTTLLYAPDPQKFRMVSERVQKMVGCALPLNTSCLHGWFVAGADAELDILPTIERLMAQRRVSGKDPPTTLKYFEGAVMDALAQRQHIPPQGNAHATSHQHQISGKRPSARHSNFEQQDYLAGSEGFEVTGGGASEHPEAGG